MKFFDLGCIPRIPRSYCADNLRLSSCAAPVSALADCVLTIFGDNWPYERGCAPYVDEPGCIGTIVAALPAMLSADSCVVRVQ